MSDEIKLYSIQEAAAILGVTVRTVTNHINAGQIKARKLCGRWRITADNLNEYINGKQ